MRAQAESGKAVFGITVDAQEAHRVIRVHEDDWPLLACQVRNTIYLNLVGTFGVASAGYWWDRLAAAIAASPRVHRRRDWAGCPVHIPGVTQVQRCATADGAL